ncbi:hypothetical protein EB796_002724 [Bugula neritina]|uniref:Uncharacterized protein n=1 Tax=Bugula neritina TaxID=10212 RepID=A0A7J7KKW4_BUGNE|nr:hypothetical protein EB796_002724 [Bugula neritina]
MSHCCKLSAGERSRKNCCGCRGATECGKWQETFADPVCWAGMTLCLSALEETFVMHTHSVSREAMERAC